MQWTGNNKDIIEWLPHRLLKLPHAFLNEHPKIALHKLAINHTMHPVRCQKLFLNLSDCMSVVFKNIFSYRLERQPLTTLVAPWLKWVMVRNKSMSDSLSREASDIIQTGSMKPAAVCVFSGL